MQILLWLVPPLVVTLVAMAWVSWVSRDAAEVDPQQAAARLERALSGHAPVRYAPRRPPISDKVGGVAVRPAREAAVRPEAAPQPAPEVALRPAHDVAVRPAGDDDGTDLTRRAS